MKKVFLLLSLITAVSFTALGQSRTTPFTVPNKTTDFGVNLYSGELVYEVDSTALYALTATFTNTNDMADVFTAGSYVKLSSSTNLSIWKKASGRIYPVIPGDSVSIPGNFNVSGTSTLCGAVTFRANAIFGTKIYVPDSVSLPQGGKIKIGNELISRKDANGLQVGNSWTAGDSLFFNGGSLASGTNTFNITKGTASLDVAAAAAINIDNGLTINGGQTTTITSEDAAGSITLDKQTFEVEGEGTATRLMKLINGADAAATVTISGTSLALTGGTNTFNLTAGTASLDVATAKAVNIDMDFTVNGTGTTITGVTQANTITLNESFTIGNGNNGTLTYTGASKTLSVEDDAVVNQDLSSDASVTFGEIAITAEINKTTTVTGDQTFSNVIPANYMLQYIVIQNTSANTCYLDLGTTAGAYDVFQQQTITASAITTIPIAKVYNLTSTAQTLYLNDDSGGSYWNSASLTVIFVMKKIN